MSENELMIQKRNQANEGDDEDNFGDTVLDAYEANRINELLVEEALRDNYVAISIFRNRWIFHVAVIT